MGKKILITSYSYFPEETPRAIRTTELVREFLKRGYEVDLFVPNSAHKKKRVEKKLNHYFVKSLKNENNESFKISDGPTTVQKIKKRIFKLIRKSLIYFIGDTGGVYYGKSLYNSLLKKSFNKRYDLIISIGLPFYVHLATARYIKKTKQYGRSFCDYGDPFYYNPVRKHAFYLKHLEKWVNKQFCFISIPTTKSINYYTEYKSKRNIKVIPQGYDFTKLNTGSYTPNKVTTFCYAGTFYETIRNPIYFFEYLLTIESNFVFVIYTQIKSEFNRELCAHYKRLLGEKLIIKGYIPREDIIRELSGMDFLINFDNDHSNQVPSKLIDYTIANRPILSINKQTFNSNTFNDFLNGDYHNSLKIDLKNYDIVKVVNQFEGPS